MDQTESALGPAAPAASGLRIRPGRWVDGWDPEDRQFWETEGRAVAGVNLRWSIFCEFLGFVVWQLWSIMAVQLPAAGFGFSTAQIFWLISMPSLVGATLRIPYTFMVPRFGGRNWTVISALLLLIPAVGLAVCVANPQTPFAVMLLMAGLAGFGGGNFASSMANITYFYPAAEKGYALGLNAAGGNLGAAVAQLVVPLAITLGAAASLNLPLGGLIWVPLILVAAWGARKYMHNLSHAKGDMAGSVAALREPHLWIMALLYIGTFGSFIGFSGVFPKLIKDMFPEFSSFAVGTAALSLAFLGPLVGSLTRPLGGRLADRFGGARMTVAAFATMAGIAVAVVWTLPLGSFWLFLALFLALFTASGFGNGATYRMIPRIFAVRGQRESRGSGRNEVDSQRKASAALGLISAIGAYGGFVIPQVLSASHAASGNYTSAFYGFVAAYVLMLAVTWFCYLRPGSTMARGGV
nr:MFS transporter [Arthrobacter crystallopoietes]